MNEQKPARRHGRRWWLLALLGAAALGVGLWTRVGAVPADPELYGELLSPNVVSRSSVIERIDSGWAPYSHALLIESLMLNPQSDTRGWVVELLERHTGERFGADHRAWFRWLLANPIELPEEYADYKAALLRSLNLGILHLHEYFEGRPPTAVRLDEIRWGDRARDQGAPLRDLTLVGAAEAGYLRDDSVVFGVEVNGEARAYPRRTLCRHEVIADVVGGEPVVGVYVPLCDMMAVYWARAGGREHRLGTSGLVYRSATLLYDQETLSLWSSIDGVPVVGRLVGKQGPLDAVPVVVTTWGAWRKLHPGTKVIPDPRTFQAYDRLDYREESFYLAYFARESLMYDVPRLDARLPNKAPVFAVRGSGLPAPLAIAADFLAQTPVFQPEGVGADLVVVTDESGATRAYEARGVQFAPRPARPGVLLDDSRARWQVREDALVGPGGRTLPRLPGNRCLWFAWYAAHPDTRLLR